MPYIVSVSEGGKEEKEEEGAQRERMCNALSAIVAMAAALFWPNITYKLLNILAVYSQIHHTYLKNMYSAYSLCALGVLLVFMERISSVFKA